MRIYIYTYIFAALAIHIQKMLYAVSISRITKVFDYDKMTTFES